jgi:hypothetical protein
MQTVAERPASVRAAGRLSTALVVGAVVWLALLAAGFVAPGGWTWGLAGPIGHMENYVISLWAVTLVLAPLIAARDPLPRQAATQVYLLGILAIVVSTFRGETPKLIADAPPLVAAAVTLGLVVWSHPRPASLLHF